MANDRLLFYCSSFTILNSIIMEYCPFKFLYYILSSRRMQLYWFKALSGHQYSIMLWTCIDWGYIAVNKTVLIRCNARGNFFKSPQLNSVLMSRRPFLYLQPIACNLHSPPSNGCKPPIDLQPINGLQVNGVGIFDRDFTKSLTIRDFDDLLKNPFRYVDLFLLHKLLSKKFPIIAMQPL